MTKLDNKIKMDIFYFQKYSKYVKQNAYIKAAINLFLTLKGCRSGCMIKFHKRYEKSFLRILKYYKMHYDMLIFDDDTYIDLIISKKPISEEVKKAFQNNAFDLDNPHIMGKFLEYPDFFNVRDRTTKNVGRIEFNFMKNRQSIKNNKREVIYSFRIHNSKVTPSIIKKMNDRLKKYKRCIKKYLYTIFPEFIINMNIALY